MKRHMAILLAAGMAACGVERPIEPAEPTLQIMGDLPTVVDRIRWDAAASRLVVDARVVEGLHTAAEEGTPLAFNVSVVVTDPGGRAAPLASGDIPLVLMKPLGEPVEGLVAVELSIPWDGTDGAGNTLSLPLVAAYTSALVLQLSTGREIVIGTETSGRLAVD